MPITIKQCNDTLPEISKEYRVNNNYYTTKMVVPESTTEFSLKFDHMSGVTITVDVVDNEESLMNQGGTFWLNEWQWKSFQQMIANANG